MVVWPTFFDLIVWPCDRPYCLTLWLTLWFIDLVADIIVWTCELPFLHVCWQLKEDYREDYRRRGHPIQRTEAIDELKNAFDLAERSCSGITDDLLTGVIGRLATTARVQEVDIRRAVDKVKGNNWILMGSKYKAEDVYLYKIYFN